MQVIVTANTAGANAALAATDKQMKKTAATGSMLSNRLSASGKASVAAVAAIGVISSKVAIDFDKNMRNVNSIAQLPEKSLARLSEQVRGLAGETAQSPQTLALGLYDLVSSGFDAAESMQILEKSATAATAGLTTTQVSTKAVAAVLNAYRLPASKAGDVSDVLFRTVDRGVISFETLAGSIGMALPAASALSVPVQDLGASIATLTKEGQSGESAVVNINAAMTALFKPTKDMSAVIKQLGYDNAETMTQTLGFQGTLEKLVGATDGTTESVGKLFANVRAQRAVFGLVGKNAAGASSDLRGLQASAGATEKALSQQSQSVSYMWNKLKAQAEDLAIGVGNELIPAMKEVLDIISDPKLSTDDKVNQVLNKTLGVIEDKGPMFAETGGKVMLMMAGGMVHSFIDANPLGKLFLAASVIRLVGGPGALGKVGMALAKPVWTAFAASTAGTTMGVAGLNIASGLAKSLSVALPGALAAYGVYKVIEDIGQGNGAEAAYGAGGMAAGALAGGMAFGLPGALAGAGIGAILGGWLGGMSDEAVSTFGKHDLAKRIAEQADKATESLKGIGDGYADASKNLRRAKAKDAHASDEAAAADRALQRARESYPANSKAVAQAELRVARAKERSKRASDELKQADRAQGAARDLAKTKLVDALGPQKANVESLKAEEKQLRKTFTAMDKSNSTVDERLAAGQAWQDKAGEVKEAQQALNKTYAKSDKLIGPSFTKKLKHMSGALGDQAAKVAKAAQKVDKLEESVRMLSVGMTASRGAGVVGAAGAADAMNRKLEDAEDAAGQAQLGMERLINRGVEPLTRKNKDLGRQQDKTTSDGKAQFKQWGEVLQSILGDTNTSLNDALSAMGVKKEVIFGKTGGTSGGGKKPGKHATGATLVPGIQGGDRHTLSLNGVPIANVESGEKIAIVNREAAKTEMAMNAMVPRYASGGVIGGATSGLHSGIMGLLNQLYTRFGGTVSSGVRAGTLHQTGMAADYVPGDWAGAAQASNSAGPSLLEGIYNGAMGGPPVSWDTGAQVDPSFWGGATWADHGDHIHLATEGGAQISGKGGFATGAAEQLSKLVFNGPPGQLTGVGQGVGTTLVDAANDYLQKHAPIQGPEGMGMDTGYVSGGNGAVMAQMGRILMRTGWNREGAAGVIGNAYRESLWNPASVGTGGGGLFGFTTSPISLADLQNYARGHKLPWTDVGLQMQFMQDHLSQEVKAATMNAGSPEAAAERFMTLWERPGIPALEERQAAARQAYNAKSWAKGGLLNLDGSIAKTYGAVDPEDGKGPSAADQRQKIAKHMKHKIEQLSQLGGGKRMGDYFTKDGTELDGKLAELRGQVDMYATYASNAGSQNEDDALGLFKGQNEIQWLVQELEALRELRNHVIVAEKETARQRKKVVDALARSKDRMHKWTKDLNKAKAQLSAEGKSAKDWKKGDPDPTKVGVKEWNDLKDKKRIQLYQKFLKNGGKLPGDRKFAEDGSILTPESHPDKFPNQPGFNAVIGLLTNTVVPGLTEERNQLSEGLRLLDDQLLSIQDAGVPKRQYSKQEGLPPLGMLGGEIFQAQSDMKQAWETVAEMNGQDSNDPSGFDISGFRDMLDAAASGVYAYEPPKYHTGGIVKGQGEVPITAMAKEGVFTVEQMAALAPAGDVDVDVHVSFEGLEMIIRTVVNGVTKEERRKVVSSDMMGSPR